MSDNSEMNSSPYINKISFFNQIKRLIWNIVWLFLFRPLPRSLGNSWRIFLLRLFGSKIHRTAVIYSSVRIYQPWKLEMHAFSCLGPEVDCYNVDYVRIYSHATVSQKSYLCTATHDISSKYHELITAPIIIGSRAWIAASVFVGPGVTIHTGAVVGATSSVFKDVQSWEVVGGNPAKFIKKRVIKDD